MAEALYESIVEESNDGILVARDGEIVYANERLQELTGYAEAELLGAPKTMLVTDDDTALVERYHSARTDGEGAPSQYEVTIETCGGGQIPIEFSVSQITYDGAPAVVAFCRDVTEQKEREHALEDLKSEYESVFENVQDALFLLDVDADGTVRFRRFNEREEAVTGKSTDEIRGKTPREVFGDTVGSELEANYRECIERQEPLVYEEELTFTDETTVWQTKLMPIVVDGTVDHVVGSGREITELKSRERELERTRTRLRALFDEAPDAIAIHDADGTILDINEQNVENLGYTRDELLRMNVTDFEVGLDPETARTTWAEMDIGETIKVSGKHQRKDDSTFPVEVWVSKIEVLGEPQYLALARDTTERKQREQRLETLTERLELAIEGAELGVWDWNVKTDEVEFNDQWAEMLGHAPGDVDDHLDAWEKRVHPEDLPGVEAMLESHLAGATDRYDSEHRMETADGDWKWIRDVGRVVERDANGDPVRAVGIHIDIDERKSYEQTLEEERGMFTQGPAVLFRWKNAEGWPVEFVSENVETVIGYSPDQFTSGEVAYAELVHEDDIGRVTEEVDTNSDNGVERFSHEPYRVVTADGDIRWVLDHTKNVWNDGEITHRQGYLVDITEQKEYEKALESAREELRQIIDLVPDLIFAKDRSGKYLLANETTAKLYGSTPERVEGRSESEVIPSVDDSEEFRQDDIEVIESGDPTFIPEEELTTADGETRIFQTTKIPYEMSETGKDAVLGYARDVTELKEYEAEVESQRDNLEVLNQMVRHDIRNDLQLVLAYTETLQSYVGKDGEEYVDQVLDAARNAIDIITTARDVTRVMLQTDTDLKRIRLRTALEGEIDDIRSNHAHALVRVEGAIPEVGVLANEMLESVFRNLLKNAVQHNDKEVPEVTVSATRADETVTVRVADNGPGISDERKAEIFEQGEMGLESEGTGLGLHLVETLVDRYGGDIDVEDNDPTGAVFVVKLPLAT